VLNRITSSLLVASILFAGCESGGNLAKLPADVAAGAGSTGEPLPVVTTIQPVRKTLVRRTEQPGQVFAFEEAPIFANVAGFVSKVHVDIGDKVKGPQRDETGKLTDPGTLLVELSIPELDQELLQKQALVAQAQSQVDQAAAAIKVAQAMHKSSVALAAEAKAAVARADADFERYDSEFQRMTALAEQGSVTKKVVEEAQNQSKAADAVRKEVAAKITSAQAIVDEKAAGVEQAEADHRAAQAKHAVTEAEVGRLKSLLQYTKLYAPFDGIVTARNIDTGHLVQPGKTSSDKPLLVVAQADTVRVFVEVPEADATLVQPGNEAVVRVPSNQNAEFAGKVARTSGSLHPTNRTLRAEIELANPDGKLSPGKYL
jgi:multidrug resistance efflux pump